MEVGIEFVLYMVGMARLLVVFFFFEKIQKVKEQASKVLGNNGETRCLQYFTRKPQKMAFKISFYFVTHRFFTADGGLL